MKPETRDIFLFPWTLFNLDFFRTEYLGTFRTIVTSRSALTSAEINANMVKNVRVSFIASTEIKKAIGVFLLVEAVAQALLQPIQVENNRETQQSGHQGPFRLGLQMTEDRNACEGCRFCQTGIKRCQRMARAQGKFQISCIVYRQLVAASKV